MSPAEELVRLARALGDPTHGHAILAEGNVSMLLDDDSMLVKASGTSLGKTTVSSLLRVRIDDVLTLLDHPPIEEADQAQRLAASVVDDSGLLPSVETPMHAAALRHGGARFVGHTHPQALNALLCSESAELVTRALFPEQVVVCGADPLFVPYLDPGLALARAVRDLLAERERPPQVVYLQNHGLVALGESAEQVLQITQMAVKAAAILLGALAAGGPVFLSDEEVARIDERLDEHYRRQVLAGRNE